MTPAKHIAALVAIVALPLSACASIPEHSDPKVVKPAEEGNSSPSVPDPPADVDSYKLVRSFIESAAAPASEHEAARRHLTEAARKAWHPSSGMLILEHVDTIPVPEPPGTPPNTQVVGVQADKVGRLLPDQSFVPESGEYATEMRVERQDNGQRRIIDPPRELVASRGSFDTNYMPVPIYFLDHTRDGVVPDLRYVVSQPESTLPRRVIDLLVTGPSAGMRSAMGTAVPEDVYPKTNTSEAADGALVVNLSELGDLPEEGRRLLAAQVVLSLESVSNARVRLQEEGVPLLPDAEELQPRDVASYRAGQGTNPELPGLAVANEQLVRLDRRATRVPGPVGSGEWDVLRAAQSADGAELATVVREPEAGVRLRVGPYGEWLPPTPVVGADMTRPSWRGGSEVWTAVNGHDVVRLIRGEDGWTPQRVDAREFSGGGKISELRLSGDGTRAAGVVDGRIVVAGVVHEGGGVALRDPTVLDRHAGTAEIAKVEWLTNSSLVATTTSSTSPVVEMSVDGYKWSSYASTNLRQPLTGLTVAPDGRVVVADQSGVWEADDPQDLWGLLQVPVGGGSIPFFPG